MNSCLYEGRVTHDRRAPHRHAFSYRMFMVYLDLDEAPGVFDRFWLWSARRACVACFRESDHGFAGPGVRLADKIRQRVQRETGVLPSGPVRLLTHLRYFGFCFNPVSFYYCFEPDGETLSFIVGEVDNTPWGERHAYVLDARRLSARGLVFEFDKRFHVSPFMPINQRYRWRFSPPAEALSIAMANLEGDEVVFRAGMRLTRRPMTSRAMASALCRFPAMTLTVVGAIYWQALRLWLKRTPFFSHPKHHSTEEIRP